MTIKEKVLQKIEELDNFNDSREEEDVETNEFCDGFEDALMELKIFVENDL